MTVQRWRSIYSTIGISQLICNGDVPASVSDEVVTTLKAARMRLASFA